MNPKVSVLMTAYNRERFIAEAVESVLAQTFTDFELIIVDDGSKDRTVEIARRYTKDPRVRVSINEKNLGDYPNRNRAAELARGKYPLKYLDSDDYLYPHGLEVMVNSMEKFPNAGLGLCRPDCRRGPYPLELSPPEAYREHFLAGGLFTPGPSATIILASSFRVVGGFSGKRFVGDTELWLELGARFSVVKMVFGLIWYRIHEGQEVGYEFANADPIHWRYKIASEAISRQSELLLPVEQRQALHHLKHLHARKIFSCALRGYRDVAWQVYRRSGLSLPDMMRGLRRPG